METIVFQIKKKGSKNMSIRKKLVSLLGTTVIAAAVMMVGGEATEVQAASYTVSSTTSDVTGEVGSTVKVPIHISTEAELRGLSGKLNGNYDSSVLQFEGMSPEGIPDPALTSTAGGNFSYLTSKGNTFKSGTLNLEFKVLKCAADPVTVTIKDLYYTDGNESSDKVSLTAKVTINHPTDQRVETVTKEPTCTEKGSKDVKCGVCGADLGTEEIPALGHKAGDWKVTKEATCTEKGSKDQLCSVCGEVIKTEEIPALGHKAGDWKVIKEATCTEKGSKEQRCTVCGEVVKTEEIEKLAHTWKTDKDTDKDGWKVITAATKDKEGSKERVCSVCGTKETATIAKLTDAATPTPTATPAATSGNKNNTTTGTTATGTKTAGGTSTGSTAVKTGDSTNVAGMVAVVVASAGILVICGVMVMRRRKINR